MRKKKGEPKANVIKNRDEPLQRKKLSTPE